MKQTLSQIKPKTTSPPRRKSPAEVVFVCMPFGAHDRPSIGVGLLQACLSQNGIAATTVYPNLDFAKRIGPKVYREFAEGAPAVLAMLGEWVFAQTIFPANNRHAYQQYLHQFNENLPLPYDGLDELLDAAWAMIPAAEALVADWVEKVLALQPRIVGLTSTFQQHTASLSLAKRLKARRPELCIVMGGANCESPMGDRVLALHPFLDAVFSGESENTFTHFAKSFLAGQPQVRNVYGSSLATTAQKNSAPAALIPTSLIPLPSAPLPPVEASLYQTLDALPTPDFDDYFASLRRHRMQKSVSPMLMFETSRGCWWGAKQHCTFCGLNGGTMAYRAKQPMRALRELRAMRRRYGKLQVVVVDNILDPRYLETFFPPLERSPIDLFYEVKSNLKKQHVAQLARAGVKRLQPGVESLSTDVLQIMRKGCTALQNIQLLKWCKEHNIHATWNYLWGFPGETPENHLAVSSWFPCLTHFDPPVGMGNIRLDRFSPNFNQSEQLGFTNVRPTAAYGYVYPYPPEDLAEVAYYFSNDTRPSLPVAQAIRALRVAAQAWIATGDSSALFSFPMDNRLVVCDLRPSAKHTFFALSDSYRWLLEACDENRAISWLRANWPGEPSQFETQLAELERLGLLLTDQGRALSLPISLGNYVPPMGIVGKLLSLAEAGWQSPLLLSSAGSNNMPQNPAPLPRRTRGDRRLLADAFEAGEGGTLRVKRPRLLQLLAMAMRLAMAPKSQLAG